MFFSLLYTKKKKKKVYWFEEQNQTSKKIAWSPTKQEFSRENGRGKMRGWPERDRLWGSSWWRRGLFRWPRLWRDDRHRAMRGTGGKHRTNPMAAISVRLGLGLGLGFCSQCHLSLSLSLAVVVNSLTWTRTLNQSS